MSGEVDGWLGWMRWLRRVRRLGWCWMGWKGWGGGGCVKSFSFDSLIIVFGYLFSLHAPSPHTHTHQEDRQTYRDTEREDFSMCFKTGTDSAISTREKINIKKSQDSLPGRSTLQIARCQTSGCGELQQHGNPFPLSGLPVV